MRHRERNGGDTLPGFRPLARLEKPHGDRVLVLKEGNGVRQILGCTGQLLPILELIVGIVDEVDVP